MRPPLTRRDFLRRGGAALAGAALSWRDIASGRALAALGGSATVAGPITGDLEPLADLLAETVGRLERKFPYASALFTSQEGIEITRDRQGKNVSEARGREAGVSLRVWSGAAFHERAIDLPTPENLAAAARALEEGVARAGDRMRIDPLPPLVRSWTAAPEIDPATRSLAERAAEVDREFERFDWNDQRVRNVRVSSEQTRLERIFVDRTRRLTSRRWIITQSIALHGLDGTRSAACLRRRGGQGGLEIARFPDEEIEATRRELVDLLAAEPPAAGEVDVVLAPEITGLLAHESFGHGVESDLFVIGRARAAQFLGKPVASPIVFLSDDPSVPGARGSYPFDDEGMLAAPTPIIEEGIFRRPLTDLASATALGLPRSANGRTEAFHRKVYARMSNTFFLPGTSEPAELLADLADGLYIQGFRNGIEDPHGWGIQFSAHLAREYKGGKPTGRVFAPITVTGHVPEILGNVRAVANDFRLHGGGCGKGFKEFVPISAGGPHVRTRARIS